MRLNFYMGNRGCAVNEHTSQVKAPAFALLLDDDLP
jgi:hypothetical protein